MREKIIAVLVGSVLLGIGVNAFLVPHQLLDGGVIGLGLLVHYWWGFPVGISIICLSLPLYILAWIFERKYFYYSIYGLVISSFFIDVFSSLYITIPLGIIPSAILGGILVGCGIGLMLRYEMSTGGTDLLAQLLGKVLLINIGVLIFFIDSLVIFSGINVVGLEKFLYSSITILFVGLMTSLCLKKHTLN
ncbi:YitT family protein [Mesobacillus harenae]|uniref:YitT family protein n=1 Tax=Mesobacillus harenae TaxID=2213203 RepID=UPI0015808BE7|nr:YitT family protein [Mesobacillus harenae]